MSEQTVAVSSPAEVADPFNGGQPTMAEFSYYRETNELPDRFKPAVIEESAPSDAPEETEESEAEEAESAGDPEPPKEPQEKSKGAEQRIKQLLAEKKRLQTELDAARKPTQTQAESSPARPVQTYQEWRKAFQPSKWIEDYAKQNPTSTYEDANAAMADHLGDVREHFTKVGQQREAERRELESKVSDARSRYGDELDEVLKPTVSRILGDQSVSVAVKQMINESELLPDVIFTLGSDEQELDKFLKLSPGKQLRYIAAIEAGIQAELSTESAPRDESGKFAKQDPPAKKQTSAPKPPSTIGGTSSRAFDVSDESLSPDEWMRKRNEQLRTRK